MPKSVRLVIVSSLKCRKGFMPLYNILKRDLPSLKFILLRLNTGVGDFKEGGRQIL